jgi:predicted PolB exonuclease-like 3'-5' exonuclease
MFNPSNLDEVCVQATHLEARGRNEPQEGSKKFFNEDKGKIKFEGNGMKNALVKKEKDKISCKYCSRDGHDEDHCWKLHPEKRPKEFKNKEKPNIAATVQHNLGSDSEDKIKITSMGFQGKKYIESIGSSSSSSLNVTQHEK